MMLWASSSVTVSLAIVLFPSWSFSLAAILMTSVAYLSSSFSTSDLALVLKSCVVSGRGSLLGLTRQVLLPFVPPGERVTEPENRVNVRRLTRLAHKQRRGVHVGCAQTRPTVSCALCSASATLSVRVRPVQLVVSGPPTRMTSPGCRERERPRPRLRCDEADGGERASPVREHQRASTSRAGSQYRPARPDGGRRLLDDSAYMDGFCKWPRRQLG